MSFLKAWEIYPSDLQIKNREQAPSLLPALIGTNESQPVIPGGVLSSVWPWVMGKTWKELRA